MSYINESKIKLNIVKQKIITSLLLNNYELLNLAFCRIYTSGITNKQWLYSGLEGGLSLVIDYRRKSARFLLFDLNTFEIIFESELYKKFNIFYSECNDYFHCFEIHNGFIGFRFADSNEAKSIIKTISILTDQNIAKRLKEYKMISPNDIKNNSQRNMVLLRKKLAEEYFFKETQLSENKITFDAIALEKLFSQIEYDEFTKTFSVKGSIDEIDELVNKVTNLKYIEKSGLKINDLKAYANEIYKNIITSSKLQKDPPIIKKK